MCNNAGEKEQELLDKYDKELHEKEYHGQYTTESAEDVFRAYSSIEKYKKEVEQYRAKLAEAEVEIFKYLLPLKGKRIFYVHEYKDERNPYQKKSKDYVFWLENDKVTHN